jgi:dephospho-CoA kinase
VVIAIGITGSIASGKTALLQYIQTQNHPVFSSDLSVKELYNDTNIAKQIHALFPDFKTLDKMLLAKAIYCDANKRQSLEKILHPLVARDIESFIKENQDKKLLFMEIPLLFEVGWEKYCDYVITLCCPPEIRAERASKRGISYEMFLAIDKTQMPEEEKSPKHTFLLIQLFLGIMR